MTKAKTEATTEAAQRNRADLHNHTIHSDGTYRPAALVEAAAALRLRAVGITDHDTIEALPEALEAAPRVGVDVVCGVEASVRFTEAAFTGTLHVLVYFSPELQADPDFRQDTRQVLAQGRGPALTSTRIAAINRVFAPGGEQPRLPRPLQEADVYAHAERITRRHFALALNDLGITKRAAVSRIIGNDSPAYVPSGIPLELLRDYVQRWPVLRVLAHPAAGSHPGESHYKEVNPTLETVEELLPGFLAMGLDGLEVRYPAHTPELEARLKALRRRYDLPLATGGSDCHDLEERPLGVCTVSLSVVEQMRSLWSEREQRLARRVRS